MGLFDIFSRWRRERTIAELSDVLWNGSLSALPFLHGLNDAERARLRELVVLFLDSKQMAGAGGLEATLTNEIRVSIAVQACVPILNLGLEYYEGWVGIVVYPGEFVAPRSEHDDDGVVHEYDETIAGEAWDHGPVILSWEDVAQSAEVPEDGYNVVIHEFAHKLDMLNGEADGAPPLHADMDRREWQRVMASAYENFCGRVDADEDTIIDPYASEHPSEFFAVMSEAFFVIPHVVKREYPELYSQFALFYRQDPAARLPR